MYGMQLYVLDQVAEGQQKLHLHICLMNAKSFALHKAEKHWIILCDRPVVILSWPTGVQFTK